jgi:hypothetical protein
VIKVAYIIGKHENAGMFSGIDWSKYDSFGLNHAAKILKTKYGFTGHKVVEDYYIENEIPYIATSPLFEEIEPSSNIDYIKQMYTGISFSFVNESDNALQGYIDAAIDKKDIKYPNYFTVLHLAIFYCLKRGYKEIVLIGCANKNGDIGSVESNTNEKTLQYQRYHTDAIIRLSPVKIWRCENINDLNLNHENNKTYTEHS